MLKICKLGEEVLRKKSVPIKDEEINDELRSLAEEMFETMENANGVGLACPQIGKNIRMFVAEADDDVKRVFINPQIIATSDDFHGYCLMADEHVTIEAPSVHDLLHLAYLPIVQLHEPKQTLAADTAQHLIMKLREIIGYLHSTHIYKGEVLRMLYSIFLLDLQNAQNSAIVHRQTPQRVEEIFIGFIRLLPRHFAEHHDIAFYADQLHISPVYLSRVVRQVTGRTVVDYINQMLLMEATFLLQTSRLSITQIADRLHFADTPSFSKFFSRLKGMSPKEYRKG